MRGSADSMPRRVSSADDATPVGSFMRATRAASVFTPSSSCARADGAARSTIRRSEEHTSELQSPCNLVCRLLLEKKNSTNTVRRSSHIDLHDWTKPVLHRHSLHH